MTLAGLCGGSDDLGGQPIPPCLARAIGATTYVGKYPTTLPSVIAELL